MPRRAAMIGIADPDQAETALAASTLACPGCPRPLQPWGHARARTVRDHGHITLVLRPRRARCRTCRVTHVLLPPALTLRRADTTAVIGSALLASARGSGYRRIAARLSGRCPRCGAGSARSAIPATMTMSIRLGTCTPAAPRRPRRHRDDHERPICGEH